MTFPELREALAKCHLTLDDQMMEQYDRYLHLLVEWNEKFNLTSIVLPEEIVEKHFYDCLLASNPAHFPNKQVLDIGSGAGFPGLVWAIAYPSSSFVLLDATQKKCLFLEEVKRALNLSNVTVIHGRAESLSSSLREHFDLVSARAVASLRILLELGAPWLKIGGTFIAMKGPKGEEELDEAHHAIKVLGLGQVEIRKATLPNEDGVRLNLYLKKERKTEKRYPRSYADVVKKPL